MPRSEHLADMTTLGLHEERAACLKLTDASFCSESVIEFHANYADRISDELDSRDNGDEPEDECGRGECFGIHRSSDGYRDCDGNPI